MNMGIANDISPKKQKKKKIINKENASIEGENFEININNVPKYSDDPFVFDHEETTKHNKEEEEVDTKKEPEEKEYFGDKKKKTGNPMTKWVVFLILVLIFLLVYQNYSSVQNIFGIQNNKEEDNSSDSLYENDYTTDTLTAEEEATSTPETDTPAETTTPESLIAADRSSLNISVLNGNGISGSAQNIKTTLTTAGFVVSHVGNALKFSYQNTIIYYNANKDAEAEDLKSVLTDRTCDLLESSSITGSYDIVVVVGTN